jgi:hypothetical protein
MGHLANSDDVSEPNVRRAVIYGTVMASFCVEEFSVKGMSSLNIDAIKRRFKDLKEVSHFDM